MKLPDTLTVTAVDNETSRPVPNVAILLLLFAERKNDYDIGPFITNEMGQVKFDRADCVAAIQQAQQMFIMDYAGNLDSCLPKLEVRLHRPEQIQMMLQQFKRSPKFWGQAFRDPARLFADLEATRNVEYEPSRIIKTEEQVLANPRVLLPLVRRMARRE